MEINFPKLEKKILRFWKENRIFEKGIEQRKRAPNFVFYEGPPTVNAKPGLHTASPRIFKDIVCRYKAMRGFQVLRKAGWDTHGLPVELEIEKKLGFKSKKDIEKYGVARFNKKCKELTQNVIKDFEKLTERIGFWLDMKNPYITSDPDYIETLWWIIKQIYQKGLLYQDFKVVPYCPRCQTSLSTHEVALGYKKIKEPAIYIKFRILNPEFKNTSLLVWTTTPWTLPGNVAIALNSKFNYAKVKTNGEYLILAKERIKPAGIEGEIIDEFKGKDLIGLRYEGLYPFNEEVLKTGYRVIAGDFVSLEEGTGLVHIAPAFGEEDMVAGKENNLPILLNVNEEGRFTLEVKKWAGLFVKEADPLITEDLKEQNLLFKEELYEHDYPFCWRCDSPLLYYAKQSWFINMQKVKKDLIKNNKKINWIPAHLKEGRFGEWLKEIRDWAFSRERYWGTPLPIWRCKKCKNLEIIGSLKDLISQKFSANNYFIFRHGHSLRQVKKLAMCWPEKVYCPLTEEGIKETMRIARKLKSKRIDLIFSSDLLRTKQTAEILNKETGAKIIFDKRLREYNVGIFNGKDPKLAWDYSNKKRNIVEAKPPKGESLIEVRKRMYNFLKGVNGKYQNKNILIVSHELPLTVLEGSLKGWPIEKILEWRRWGKEKTIKTSEWREIEFKNLPYNEKGELDFHRPYVDGVKFYCLKCKTLMERVPEVIDCWFDSGSMPFAQYHYPFENKNLIARKIQFPADYISEAVDQTRGWFYTLHAISTLLKRSPAYKNVISLGHVLDEKGEKMSKSKGNAVDPWLILEKYGSDATRWYFYTVNQPGDAKLFSEREIEQCLKRFLITFWNCYLFFETYKTTYNLQLTTYNSKNTLDKWIISKLNELIQQVTENLDKYEVTFAGRNLENFVIEDLSLWYIRRSRRRFQKPETKRELEQASTTLGYVLLTLSKLTAPFVPFLSESIYVDVRRQHSGYPKLKPKRAMSNIAQSVHLEDWPKANKKLINKKLEKKMERAREIVARVLSERAKAKIKVRQPLSELRIKNYELRKEKALLDLIREEVNVKEITFGKTLKLDTKITPELKEEGQVREVIRHIQEMRKEAKFKPRDKILVRYLASPGLEKILIKNEKIILKEGKIKDFGVREKERQVFDVEKDLKVDKEKLWLGIKKI